MSKTQAEIDDLKKQWIADGCWDIEDTEGFEDHREELITWRKTFQAERRKQARQELEKRAKKSGLTPEAQEQAETYEKSAETSASNAEKLLLHYFELAGVRMDFDNRGEIKQIVDEIVEASTAAVLAELVRKKVLSTD